MLACLTEISQESFCCRFVANDLSQMYFDIPYRNAVSMSAHASG